MEAEITLSSSEPSRRLLESCSHKICLPLSQSVEADIRKAIERELRGFDPRYDRASTVAQNILETVIESLATVE